MPFYLLRENLEVHLRLTKLAQQLRVHAYCSCRRLGSVPKTHSSWQLTTICDSCSKRSDAYFCNLGKCTHTHTNNIEKIKKYIWELGNCFSVCFVPSKWHRYWGGVCTIKRILASHSSPVLCGNARKFRYPGASEQPSVQREQLERELEGLEGDFSSPWLP